MIETLKMPKVAPANDRLWVPAPATMVKVQPMTDLDTYFEFKLDSGKPLGHRPGQFVHISVPGIGEAPISVSSPPGDTPVFQMLIRRMGNVTNALHRMKPGAKVGIRGPYGTSFPVDTAMKGKDILYIAGGCGLAPVRSSIAYTLKFRANYGKVYILYGCKKPSERLFTDDLADFRSRGDVVFLETVDRAEPGWTGPEGVITTLMPKVTIDPARTIGIVCGPPVMYKFVITQLQVMKVSPENTYISLERHMKCGVGKCGHCQVNGVYCCQDGPVFRLSDVAGMTEAM